MFPASSSSVSYPSTSSQSNGHQTYHESIAARRRDVEVPYLDQYSKISSSSPPMSSHSRPHLSYRSSSPSRPTYHQNFQSRRQDNHPARYSSKRLKYSQESPYARRASSPLMSSSSPPPSTSPPMSPYGPKVRIVGRDVDESYLIQNDDNSPLNRRTYAEQLRPKLPSFQSLFGNNERQQLPVPDPHLHLRKWDSESSFHTSSPSLLLDPQNLPPLRFPPLNARNPRRASTPSKIGINVDSYAACHPDVIDAGDTAQSPTKNAGRVFKESDKPYLVQSSFRTPTRSIHLPSNADPTPGILGDEEPLFSPSKISPYPRRTFFLESSERDRTSPVRPQTYCDLQQLAEIADSARSSLPVPKQSPEPTEETSVDSATSRSSSPAVYQSSLPPSSPPTSEAQLSPVVNVKELAVPSTAPLTDVMDVTAGFEEHEDDLGLDGIESHKSLKATEEVSETDPIALKSGDQTSSSNNPNILDSTHKTQHDTVTPSGDDGPGLDMLSVIESDHFPTDVDSAPRTDAVSLEVLECDRAIAAGLSSDREVATETVIEDCVPHVELNTSSTPTTPKSVVVLEELSYPANEPMSTSPTNPVSIFDRSGSSPTGTFESIKQPLPRKIFSKSKMKPSTAPSIASSAPRVTVTVVKRMKPASNLPRHRNALLLVKSLDKEKQSTVKGKQKDILRASTSEVVNSRNITSKRLRDSEETAKERAKGSEAPQTKKLKVCTDEDRSKSRNSSSTLAEVITTSFNTSASSPSDSSLTIPAKRKADDDAASACLPRTPSRPFPKSVNKACIPSLPPPSSKKVYVEITIPKQKASPAVVPSSPTTSSWVEENWVDAVAAAYGSPSSRGSKAPSPRSTLMRQTARKKRAENLIPRSDLSPGEEEKPKSLKMRSPRSRRMLVESDSEDDSEMEDKRIKANYSSSDSDSELEARTINRPAKARGRAKRPMISSSPSESDLTASEDDDDQSESSSDEEVSSKPLSKPQQPKSIFPPPSPLDLELIGIIIETMSMSRSSSHLASALYRTVRETRSGFFGKLIKTYPAHFETATEESQFRKDSDPLLQRRRSKRGAAANDEGGVAGLSEVDIMWVSEFERVMKEAASRFGMFGMVESSFRNDPRDCPLPFSSRFFYVPDRDPDTERAQLIKLTMPGAGKRSETKKYKQYYWKPVGK